MIVFGDLETTGLDVHSDQILEVGLVVTDDDLRILAETAVQARPITCLPLPEFVKTLDLVVQKMHEETGLWSDVERFGLRRHEAEEKLESWLRGVAGYHGSELPLTLAGNSVWFDLVILRREMPKLGALFEHRVIDVSTVNQIAKRRNKAAFEARPRATGKKHRALDDARESRLVLDYYADEGLFPSGRYEGWGCK